MLVAGRWLLGQPPSIIRSVMLMALHARRVERVVEILQPFEVARIRGGDGLHAGLYHQLRVGEPARAIARASRPGQPARGLLERLAVLTQSGPRPVGHR